jgi:hypothetical protein
MRPTVVFGVSRGNMHAQKKIVQPPVFVRRVSDMTDDGNSELERACMQV